MNNQVRVLPNQNPPVSAASSTSHSSVGDININVGGAPLAGGQAGQYFAGDETSSDRFVKVTKGITNIAKTLALGTVATVVGLVAYEYAENKQDSFAGKMAQPDVTNTTLNIPAPRVTNNMPKQVDYSPILKEIQDSMRVQKPVVDPVAVIDTNQVISIKLPGTTGP